MKEGGTIFEQAREAEAAEHDCDGFVDSPQQIPELEERDGNGEAQPESIEQKEIGVEAAKHKRTESDEDESYGSPREKNGNGGGKEHWCRAYLAMRRWAREKPLAG